ncbi:hypothetical protein [Nakamurella multipartita]|jgi:hypothetical protein|uniref:Uncharacterized protein n=1 Tax=Nakamurella multipartita (strain ATCC 700099 / DSM 44233 / CIP 104796 / JCM 9543 / NBRC 105858 / Y-104) TaxID=479431 RepID=C8X6C0_NAKMY|nr:hypothetical protein [Nakamurella multipartita]ACV78775.1 hypothetical protein Namu_2401 [Nakamurella multipartita DSM 44233]
MAFPALTTVRAARDIRYGVTTAVPLGAPGRIVNRQAGWGTTTYTVEFNPDPGSTVTLVGLKDSDLQSA